MKVDLTGNVNVAYISDHKKWCIIDLTVHNHYVYLIGT